MYKEMINFNNTIIIRLKSMYELLWVLMFPWSRINSITYTQTTAALSAVCLQPPHSFSIHLSSLICPPWPPPHTGFYSAPQDVSVCVRSHWPGPRTGTADLNNAPPPTPADHVIRSTAAHARMSRLARHVTLTRYWNALTAGPSWIISNTGLAYKLLPEVTQYTCWAGSALTLTMHVARYVP